MRKENKCTLNRVNRAKDFVYSELSEVYSDLTCAVRSHGEKVYEPEDQSYLLEIGNYLGKYIYTFHKSIRPFVAAVIVATEVWVGEYGEAYSLPPTKEVLKVLPLVKNSLKKGELDRLTIRLVDKNAVLATSKTAKRNRTFQDGCALVEEIFDDDYVNEDYYTRRVTYRVPLFG